MEKDKEYNYGLALLRILMCFEVILCHFYNGGGVDFYFYLMY